MLQGIKTRRYQNAHFAESLALSILRNNTFALFSHLTNQTFAMVAVESVHQTPRDIFKNYCHCRLSFYFQPRPKKWITWSVEIGVKRCFLSRRVKKLEKEKASQKRKLNFHFWGVFPFQVSWHFWKESSVIPHFPHFKWFISLAASGNKTTMTTPTTIDNDNNF